FGPHGVHDHGRGSEHVFATVDGRHSYHATRRGHSDLRVRLPRGQLLSAESAAFGTRGLGGPMRSKEVFMRTVSTATLGAIVMLGSALGAGAAWAHHAFSAEFDADKPVRLEGKIAKMELINPHSWIHLDVENPDGT